MSKRRRYSKPVDRAYYLLDFMSVSHELSYFPDVESQHYVLTKHEMAYVLECSLPTAIIALEILMKLGFVADATLPSENAKKFIVTKRGKDWHNNHSGYVQSHVKRYQMIIDHNRSIL